MSGPLGKPNYQPIRIEGIRFFPALGWGWTNWKSEARDTVSVKFDTKECVATTTWNGEVDDRTGMEKLRDRLPWIARPAPPQKLMNVL